MVIPEGKKNEGIILVTIEGETRLQREVWKENNPNPEYWQRSYSDKDITTQVATLFDTRTMMWSDNSVYIGSKGLYIKKGGKRYYLGDFK
jgi:hypothetical protein